MHDEIVEHDEIDEIVENEIELDDHDEKLKHVIEHETLDMIDAIIYANDDEVDDEVVE